MELIEYEFASRSRAFQRLQDKKTSELNKILWDHEAEYRRLRRCQVLMEFFYGKDVLFVDEDDHLGRTSSEEYWDCGVEVVTASPKQTEDSWWKAGYDFLVFEACTTLPTIFSLFMHCVLHIGIYESMGDGLTFLGGYTGLKSENAFADNMVYAAAAVAGVLLLRLSGDFYWWSSNTQYLAVKFHLHNRYLLGEKVGGLLMFVKNRPVVRATCYMLGYYLCYFAVNHFHSRFVASFDFREDLLKDLPSNGSDLQSYVLDLVDEADTSKTGACRDIFLQLQEEAQELRAKDEDYTFQVLSVGSYETYWAEQTSASVNRHVEGLIDPLTDWYIYIATIVLAIVSLIMVSSSADGLICDLDAYSSSPSSIVWISTLGQILISSAGMPQRGARRLTYTLV